MATAQASASRKCITRCSARWFASDLPRGPPMLGWRSSQPRVVSPSLQLADAAPTGPLTPQAAGVSIARHLPEGAIICDDSVTSGGGVAVPCSTARPHDVLALTGGAIGIGGPLAIGAAPPRRIARWCR